MKMVYPAIFTEDEGSFVVEFPDLVGCQTFGDTLEETMEFAEEALSGYLVTILEDGQIPNKPSDIKDIRAENGFVSLVSCSIEKYRETKAVKKTLTIPEWMNSMAIDRGVNFSEVLQEGLIRKMGIGK